MLLEDGVCCDQCVLLAKLCWPLPSFVLYSKAKFACYSRYLLTSYFCIPVPYNEEDIFFGVLVLHLWSQQKSTLLNRSLASLHGRCSFSTRREALGAPSWEA